MGHPVLRLLDQVVDLISVAEIAAVESMVQEAVLPLEKAVELMAMVEPHPRLSALIHMRRGNVKGIIEWLDFACCRSMVPWSFKDERLNPATSEHVS